MDMDGEDSQDSEGDEEGEDDARPSKRNRMVLDSDEAGLASSMRSIRPTPGATSQYHQDNENESDDGDATGRVDDQPSDFDDVDRELPDPSDTGGDDDHIGFQDNGVCFQKFC
jgi:hypothetical protein